MDGGACQATVHRITKSGTWLSNFTFFLSGSSGGKEFTCNAGDSSSIFELGSSPGERIGYLPQYSWASLVAQIVKNTPAMQETCIQSLSLGDPLEEGMATHFSILAWRIYGQRSLAGCSQCGRQESDMAEQLSAAQHDKFHFILVIFSVSRHIICPFSH